MVIAFIQKAIAYSCVNKSKFVNMEVVVYNVLNHVKKKKKSKTIDIC
jgi:hypothetical protein